MKISDEVETFAEYNHVVNIMKVTKQVWQNSFKVSETWCDVFKTLNIKNISITNF